VQDIKKILDKVPEEDKEVYLVLSATTKYKDLKKISEVYRKITEYYLIFTKLDETDTVGNIFNIHMLTGAQLRRGDKMCRMILEKWMHKK